MLSGLEVAQMQQFLRLWDHGPSRKECNEILGRLSQTNMHDMTVVAVLFWQVHKFLTLEASEILGLLPAMLGSLQALEAAATDILTHSGEDDLIYNMLYGLYISNVLSKTAVPLWDIYLAFKDALAHGTLPDFFDTWVRTSVEVATRSTEPGFMHIVMEVLREFLGSHRDAQRIQRHILAQVMQEGAAYHATQIILETAMAGNADPNISTWGMPLMIDAPQAQQQASGTPQPTFAPPTTTPASDQTTAAMTEAPADAFASNALQNDFHDSSDSASDTIAVAQHPPASTRRTVQAADDADNIVVAHPRSKAATRGNRQFQAM